jgi:hypothetical protein
LFSSTEDLVKLTAHNLGYTLTDYRVADITYRVEQSPEVIKYSKEICLTKVAKDLTLLIIPSICAFLIGLVLPIFNQAKVQADYSITGVTLEQSITSGADFFNYCFSVLFLVELIWLMSNLFLEKKASNKMILYFLQIREDVRK